jgi:hypothetical protein
MSKEKEGFKLIGFYAPDAILQKIAEVARKEQTPNRPALARRNYWGISAGFSPVVACGLPAQRNPLAWLVNIPRASAWLASNII